MSEKQWTLENLWNDTLISEPFEVKERDYIRASDVGKAMLDRYYSMTGVEPTDPFDARVLRVFEAGNIYEWLVRLVLIRAGILRKEQTKIEVKGTDHLPLFGRLDFIGGGKPDWAQAESIVPLLTRLHFPQRMLTISEKLIGQLKEKNLDNLEKLLIEVKSINSLAFWRHNKVDEVMKAYPHHILQLYSYMKGAGFDKGRIFYVSKDDLTLREVEVVKDEELETQWRKDVQTISHFYRNKIEPPKEPDIKWSADKRKFEVNWKLGRSVYFEKITSLRKDFWQVEIKKLVNRLNYRVKNAIKDSPEIKDIQIRDALNDYLKADLAKIYGDPAKVVIQRPILIRNT